MAACFACFLAVAQPTPDEKGLTVKFGKLLVKEKLPFGEITVSDGRFDTTKIGYLKKKKKDRKLVTEGGLATAFQQLLKDAVNSDPSAIPLPSVWMVIKRFWLRPPTDADYKKLYRDDERPGKSFWAWSVKLELYAGTAGLYTPLFRIDSIYYTGDVDEGIDVPLAALEDCLARLQKTDAEKTAQAKTKLARRAIDSFNRVPFQKPILQNPEMQPGVFLTFSDFLNNRVRHPEFDVEFGNETDNLYVVNNGSKELLPVFWGFCDGKNYYIRCGRNFYGLYKAGNAFEFVGALSADYLERPRRQSLIPYDYRTGPGYGAMAADAGLGAVFFKKNRKIEVGPFQLNMETGEVY